MSGPPNPLELLPLEALVKTGEVDHADWNYRPVIGRIQGLRFRLITSLMGERHFPALLEVGYGSGVFMPELRTRCDALFGADLHDKPAQVAQSLQRYGVEANLATASVTSLPYADSMFHAIVIVSTLEYVDDIDRACEELTRVMRPDGRLFLVTPGASPLVDFGLRVLTGESASGNYTDRRARLIPALERHFRVERRKIWPRLGTRLARLYNSFELTRPGLSDAC